MKILDTPSRSLREFRLLPGHTPAGCEVDLTTRLCRSKLGDRDTFLTLGLPVMGAAMRAVTGPEMAIALAQSGAMGCLPVSQSIEEHCRAVAEVKRFKAGFQTDLHTLSPQQSLEEVVQLMKYTGYSSFPVTDNGIFHGRLLGVLTDKDFDAREDLACSVASRMRKDVQVGIEPLDLATANRLMIEYGRGMLPIVSEEGTLVSAVFKRDRDRHLRHPLESVDHQRRLRVAAAVSTHPEDRERVMALLGEDVDLLVIDSSDGHTEHQDQMLRFIASQDRCPVIAGNVVTAEGFEHLAQAGADAIKVGMGIGSGCITQEVKATGRGQASALIDVARARDEHLEKTGQYIPIIADGSIRSPAQIIVSLALGADSVMLGNWLARYSESPGKLVMGPDGERFKEYWMEGSRRGANYRRYGQSAALFVAEGIEGLVPHAGSVYDGLPQIAAALKSALLTAGCPSISSLHRDAVLERLSPTALGDSAVGGMQARPGHWPRESSEPAVEPAFEKLGA